MSAKVKANAGAGKKGEAEVYFKCRECGKEKPLPEMRTVTRFVPVLVVCQDCARRLR